MAESYLLYKFFGYWQIVVCTFAFIALFAIHRRTTKNQERRQRDNGLLWLSLAILTWSFSGLIDVNYAHALTLTDPVPQTSYQGLRSIFSIVNSAFILLALPQFKHIPRPIQYLIKSDGWRLTVGVSFALSAIMTLMMYLDLIIPSQPNFIYFIDLLYAIFTLSFLGIILWSSFAKRGLKILAYLSALSILFTLIAQFQKLDEEIFWSIFFNCIFKTILIVLFFALALSWVEELAKKFIPEPTDLHLIMLKKKTPPGRYHHLGILSIPPYINMHQINLSEATYHLLATFASKRKNSGPSEGWLEIQPKSSTSNKYDIKDHKQISRLVDAIFESIINHDQSKDPILTKLDLRQALFDQNRQRKIRLRIAPENIDLTRA